MVYPCDLVILILDRFLGLEEVLKNQLVIHVLQIISQIQVSEFEKELNHSVTNTLIKL